MINNTKNFDENDYEFNSDSNIGVMIIHGFTSTTYEVKELAQFLSLQGFHTIAKNLPGHGTNVEDCNKTKYREWLEFVEQNYAEMMSKIVKQVKGFMGVSFSGDEKA